MEVVSTRRERIIQPCTLAYFEHELGPYVGCEHRCLYCYTQNKSEVDWERQVAVFPDFQERIGRELDSLSPQLIFIGMDTDPYQPIESDYRHTRITLEEMATRGFSGSILTKSDLVIRDLDLLTSMSKAEVGVSISFLDESVRTAFELASRPTQKRIEVLKKAKQAGIEPYALISPVMPLMTDVDALIEEVALYADTIWIYSLEVGSPRDRNWQRIEQVLAEHFPEIENEFKTIALSPTHAYWKDLKRDLEVRASRDRLKLEIHL